MDCSPPGSSVHGILQVRILGWVAIPFSRGSSQCRGWNHFSMSPALAGRFFTIWATREALINYILVYLRNKSKWDREIKANEMYLYFLSLYIHSKFRFLWSHMKLLVSKYVPKNIHIFVILLGERKKIRMGDIHRRSEKLEYTWPLNNKHLNYLDLFTHAFFFNK